MKLYHFPVFILITLTALLSFAYVHPGHILGGDFSLYLRQTESLCRGDMQKVFEDMQVMLSNSTDNMYSPTLYPWGYPILIAPLYSIFGLNLYPYKIVQWLFVNAGVVFFYLQLRKLPGFSWQALLVALIVGVQPIFSTYIFLLLSELSYFFFIMFSIYFMRRVFVDKPLTVHNLPKYIGVGVLFLFTSQIRTEGFLLFPTLLVVLLAKRFRAFTGETNDSFRLPIKHFLLLLIIPFFSALFLYTVSSIFLPSGFLRHIDHTSLTTWHSITSNAEAYFHDIGKFIPFQGMISISFFLFFALLGMTRRFKTHLFEIVFLFLSMILLFIWPHQNTRHLLALFPFLIFFFVSGVDYIVFSWLGKPLSFYLALLMLLLLLPPSVMSSIEGYRSTSTYRKPYGFEATDYKALVNVVDKTIPLGDHIAFAHNRALYLSTGRVSFPAFGPIQATRKQAQWYICCVDGGSYFQYPLSEMELEKQFFREVYKNKSYILYRVLPIPIDSTNHR